MTQRPRALVISARFLFPLDEGGKIRTFNILRHMKGGPIELMLASPAPDNKDSFASQIDEICDHFVSWPARKRSMARRVAALAGSLPVSAATDLSATGRATVQYQLSRCPDLLLVDFPQTAILLPEHGIIPSVVFAHNVEAEILERHANLNSGLWRMLWANEARKMRSFEARTLRRFDRVLAASNRDADILARNYGLADVRSIGTGVDLDFYPYSAPETISIDSLGGKIVFVGAMDGAANIDAIKFFLREIWPRVAQARPGAQALIVGRNPPKALVRKALRTSRKLVFTGAVDDVRAYIRQSDISVIPMRSASGTRIKAFEAMALGRPVVSTLIGMEGLDVTPGVHYLAADDPRSFAAAILRLLNDLSLRSRLAESARSALEEKFSWRIVARKAQDVCLELLEAKATIT